MTRAWMKKKKKSTASVPSCVGRESQPCISVIKLENEGCKLKRPLLMHSINLFPQTSLDSHRSHLMSRRQKASARRSR